MASYDVTLKSSALEFDTINGTWNAMIKWSSTRVINVWKGEDGDAQVQAFDVNAGTGAVTAIGSFLEFDTNSSSAFSIVAFDSTHFNITWRDATDGHTASRMFAIDGSGNISTAGAEFTSVSVAEGLYATLFDSTHILVIGYNSGGKGVTSVLTVNTGTWAITEASTSEFYAGAFGGYPYGNNPRISKIDATHYILAFSGDELRATVLAVNTSTWAVTDVGALNSFDPNTGQYVSVQPLDGVNHFIVVYRDNGDADVKAEVLEVNTSTWAITPVGTVVTVKEGTCEFVSSAYLDSTHCVIAWGNSTNYETSVVAIDGSWNVTNVGTGATISSSTEYYNLYNSVVQLDGYRFVASWNDNASDGFIQAFDITPPASGPANLKSFDTNLKANIKSIDTNLIANIKALDTNV